MLPFRRFPLRQLLPSWWFAPWVGGLLLAIAVAHQSLTPELVSLGTSGIEWPIHEGGPCLGSVQGITMPPLRSLISWSPHNKLPYLSLTELETARSWQTVTFTGKPLADFMSLQTAEICLNKLKAAANNSGGVRLRFSRSVSYSCFFEVLFRVWVTGQQVYWLDVRHTPMTLYVVNLP